jgi:hypothetical protein
MRLATREYLCEEEPGRHTTSEQVFVEQILQQTEETEHNSVLKTNKKGHLRLSGAYLEFLGAGPSLVRIQSHRHVMSQETGDRCRET